ncbi:hypothetical protein D9611_007440 [Ephemerocybe angulata]|uniref:F-box domain-containing protein n=1 Tax=Ephemerocybe angulata TaxID=980116 RepID=A0A8H5FKW9_9AGAR|nr:hypothetical protein D9611_007440 [Tulosesus angulatus]
MPFITSWARLPNELKDLIFGYLSLSDIISFANVSLPFRFFAIKFMRHRLTQLIEPYRLPLYTLLLVLDRTNSVISGSLALELVHPTGLNPNNLDIFCPNQEADDLCGFLTTKGYFQVPDDPVLPLIIDDVQGHNSIEAVRTLRHLDTDATIHIVVSTSSSALAPVFASHSTFVMNFISAAGIYSCYPSLTEQNKGMRIVTDNVVDTQPRRQLDQAKYLQRGFSYIEDCSPLSATTPHTYSERCLHYTRTVTDPITAVFPFDIFCSSCSFWPKTEWRSGCRLELRSGEIVTAESLIQVYCDGDHHWMHGNNLGRMSLQQRTILSTLTASSST